MPEISDFPFRFGGVYETRLPQIGPIGLIRTYFGPADEAQVSRRGFADSVAKLCLVQRDISCLILYY